MSVGNGKRVAVIGGGPGGYVAAIRAAQLGAEVTLVDKGGLGGTCLHRGCIPTKFLIKAAKEYSSLVRLCRDFGMAPPPEPNLAELMKQKDQIVNQLYKGTNLLLKKNNVRVIDGTASFVDAQTMRVLETGEELKSKAFIIATGSESIRPPIDGMDLPNVMGSDEILDLETLSSSLAIIGGGYIGLEFGQIFHMLGVEVSIVEMLPRILAVEDEEISMSMLKILTDSGLKIYTSALVDEIANVDNQLRLSFTKDERTDEIRADAVLVSVGRRPYIKELELDRIGIHTDESGVICVNSRLETNVPGVYAIGDLVGGMMLAHKASAEGECAAENAVGGYREISYMVIPSVMYTHPEMASVGILEKDAKERYGDLLIGRFPFFANGRAVLEGSYQGFVKVIAEAENRCIIGTGIIGPQAGHLIGEAALAIQMEATLEDVAETMHAHPTLSEAFREAVLDARGEAVHIPPR